MTNQSRKRYESKKAAIQKDFYLLFGLFALFAFPALNPLTLQAAIRPALTCNAGDVQNAMNSAGAGDTVTIPAGTCTWTTPVNWTAPANVTLQGAGSQSVVGGGDKTVIIDDINRTSSDIGALVISANAPGTFRLTGITIQGTTDASTFTDNGTIRIGGTSQQVRLDHFHIQNLRRQGITMDGVWGVVDHAVFDMISGTLDNAIRPNGVFETWGDPEWAGATNFGSSQFMYAEDNVFNNGIVNDCVGGGKQVYRHNTMNNASVQTHPTGSQGRQRGCRAMEVYQNTFNGTGAGNCSPNCFNVYFLSSGGALIWNNSSGSGVYQNFLTIHSMRKSNGTYAETPTPNGWGGCGTSF